MERLFAVLALIGKKLAAAFAVLLAGTSAVTLPSLPQATTVPNEDRTKITLVPASTTPITIPFPTLGPTKQAATTTTQSIPKPVTTTTKAKAPVPAPKASETPPLPAPATKTEESAPVLTPGDLNVATRAAIVNVLCNVGGAGSLDPISGTGIIVDPKGVVLTNAHVGQFFLLRDYPTKDNIDCILRAGNPARPLYRAQLMYLPLAWMQSNASKIIQQNPTGTGERDYALLYITEHIDKSPLPSALPYITPYTGEAFALNDEMLLAGYPADLLGGITIQTNLNVASAFGKIQEIFTFHEGGSTDLISIPGTILSQRGASGGAVVAPDGKLAGIISTATQGGQTGGRDLRAITLYHVDRTLTEDTGHSLLYYLMNDPAAQTRLFTLGTAPTLTKMLTQVLNR